MVTAFFRFSMTWYVLPATARFSTSPGSDDGRLTERGPVVGIGGRLVGQGKLQPSAAVASARLFSPEKAEPPGSRE